MKHNALLNLLLDGLLRPTIRRVESLIAAKSTAACADFAIPIGTTEACVDANLLHAAAKLLREIVAITIETSVVAPGISSRQQRLPAGTHKVTL